MDFPDDPPRPVGELYGSVEELVRARLSLALGGWRGAVESALPTVVFAIVWAATSELRASLIGAAAICLAALSLRLVQRQDPRFVAYAIVAVGISAFFALRSGRAEDAFVPGLVQNAVVAAITLAGNLLRWPLLGFLIGAGDPATSAEDPFAWHRHEGVIRLASKLTWVLIALYAVRLGIMLPLYLAGNVAALAVSKVVLGWPLYLAALATIGVLLVRGHTPITGELATEAFTRRHI